MGRCGKAIVLAGIATALVVGIPNSTVFSRSQDLKSRAEKAFVVNEKREGSILPNSVKNVSDKKEKVGVVQRLVDGLSIKKCYAGENKDSTNRSPDGIFWYLLGGIAILGASIKKEDGEGGLSVFVGKIIGTIVGVAIFYGPVYLILDLLNVNFNLWSKLNIIADSVKSDINLGIAGSIVLLIKYFDLTGGDYTG